MEQTASWYEITDTNLPDSPVLLVFPERVKLNIATAIAMVGDVNRLRPHIKTHKSPDVVQLMLDAGITKFKCATIAEAEILGMVKAPDTLLAYQPLGPKLQRFISLIKKYPTTLFSCITDNLAAAKAMASAFSNEGITVPVYIDLNIGMNRTGIIAGPEAVDLYSFLSSSTGVKAAGLHAYDGHIRDADIQTRTKKCDEAFQQVKNLRRGLEEKGFIVPAIVAGGSPSFPIHAYRADVECSPGTFVYWDKGYSDGCPEQAFVPAAVLMTRIVSMPLPTVITTDLGHKSVAAENEIGKRVHFLNTTGLQVTGQSEEHLVAVAEQPHSFREGNILYGLPFHICPTVALYERVLTVEDGKVTGEWKNSARDRKITV